MLDRNNVFEAAKQANSQYGQWMPQQWLDLFVAAYNRMESRQSQGENIAAVNERAIAALEEIARGPIEADTDGYDTCIRYQRIAAAARGR